MNQQQWEAMGASPEMAKALAESDDSIVRAEALLSQQMARRLMERTDAEIMGDALVNWVRVGALNIKPK